MAAGAAVVVAVGRSAVATVAAVSDLAGVAPISACLNVASTSVGTAGAVASVAEQHTAVLTVGTRSSAVRAVANDQNTVDDEFGLVARTRGSCSTSGSIGPGVTDQPSSRTGPGLRCAAEQSVTSSCASRTCGPTAAAGTTVTALAANSA